jgi:hypothetical protein
MSSDDSYSVFQCPNCQKYVSNKADACRFCGFPLSDQVKAKAIEKESDDNRQFRRKGHKAMLYTGLGVFVLGLFLSAASYTTIFVTGQGFYFPWSPVIALVGLGQILYGFLGMREERKNNFANV